MNNAIVIIVNESYFKYVIPFLNSLKRNWNNHPRILCHYSNMNDVQLEKLNSYSGIELISVDLQENEKGILPKGRKQDFFLAYTKLRLFSNQYDQYDNILYLDIDSLILKPLDVLISKTEFTIFKDRWPQIFLPEKIDDKLKSLLIEDNILPKINSKDLTTNIGNGEVIANSGVFLIPKKYRTEENRNSVLYILNRYKEYVKGGDQPIINLWCLLNNIKTCYDSRFNFLVTYLKNENCIEYNTFNLEDIYILHFCWYKPLDKEFLQDFLKKNAEDLHKLYHTYL